MLKKLLISSILVLSFTTALRAQWVDGGCKEQDPNSSTGCLYVYNGVMYYFNFEKYMQKSTDNGATWIDLLDSGLGQKGPGLSRKVVQMQYFNGRLYAGLNYGTSGALYYSTDGGDYWLQDTLGIPGGPVSGDPHPNVIRFCAWSKWVAVQYQGNALYYIREEGQPFKLDSFMFAPINHPQSFVASGDTLFCLCANYGLCYTTDGGKTYIKPANAGFSGNFPDGLYLEGSRLYAFMLTKQSYVLFYTDDRGASWSQIDISGATNQKQLNGNPVQPIAAFIKGNFIELTFQPTKFNQAPNAWQSKDLGKTWSVDTTGLPNLYLGSLDFLAYTPDGYLWAVRDHQSLYKQKIGSGTTGSVATHTAMGAVTVMPNPSTDHFTFTSSSETGGTYKLIDLLGRTVRSGDLLPGMTQHEVNVSGLAAGMYQLEIVNTDGALSAVTVVVE